MTVAGFGFRKQASLASLRDALAQALAHPAVRASACGPITLFATAQDKADATCVQALAAEGFTDSRLYAGDYDRRFRPATASGGQPAG